MKNPVTKTRKRVTKLLVVAGGEKKSEKIALAGQKNGNMYHVVKSSWLAVT